ncbi:MAG: hypothetical protein AAFQ24_12390 [Pseudomonadota bacterium]
MDDLTAPAGAIIVPMEIIAANNGDCRMSNENKASESSAPGLILLSISCVTVGYGLCGLVNNLGNGLAPIVIGLTGAVLSLSLIVRNRRKN